MRFGVTAAALVVAALVPRLGIAQAPGAVAGWPRSDEPLQYAGAVYYPSGPTVFFDANVMVQTGTYRGIPLFADTTLEPYSVVYVPVGRDELRPYERQRAHELEGTVGSRTPSFPVEDDVEVSAAAGRGVVTFPPPAGLWSARPASSRAVGTSGAPGRERGRVVQRGRVIDRTMSRPTRLESIPRPRADRGVWLEYGGARWRQAGNAMPYEVGRFEKIGEYRGFPVFRDRGDASALYIPSVAGGLLTPYRR